MPSKLEAIEKEFLQDEEVVLVSHDFIRVDKNLQDLNILDETNLNTRRITKSYAKKDWSNKLRESILLRKGFWLGSAYAVRKKAILLERFERLIAQHAPENLAYREGFRLRDTLDLLLGSFIVASNPTFKVGFVNEVLFKHRAHGNNTNTGLTSISVEKALCTIESWQLMHATTYHMIADFLTDKKIERRYTDLHEQLELVKLQFAGKKIKAIGKFISLSPLLFKEKAILHEFMRLLFTTFLGSESFIRWNTKRKNLFNQST